MGKNKDQAEKSYRQPRSKKGSGRSRKPQKSRDEENWKRQALKKEELLLKEIEERKKGDKDGSEPKSPTPSEATGPEKDAEYLAAPKRGEAFVSYLKGLCEKRELIPYLTVLLRYNLVKKRDITVIRACEVVLENFNEKEIEPTVRSFACNMSRKYLGWVKKRKQVFSSPENYYSTRKRI